MNRSETRRQASREPPQEEMLRAMVQLAERAPGAESQRLLKRALAGYRDLLAKRARVTVADKTSLLLAISDVTRLLVPQIQGPARREALRHEVAALRNAASLFKKAGVVMDEASARCRLGNALIELAEVSSGKVASSLGAQAVQAFQSGLAIESLPPEFYALFHDGVGRALRDKCKSLTGKASLDGVTAAEHEFKSALDCADDESDAELLAQIFNNLAGTLACKADHLSGRERASCMSEVVAAFKAVASLYDPEEAPEDSAMARHNLASALGDQAKQLGGRRRDRALETCEQLYRDVLGVYTAAAYPSFHANTMRCLAEVLYERALDQEGARRCELLAAAWKTIQSAGAVGSSETADQAESVRLMLQGRIATALAKEANGERSALLAEAERAFRAAMERERASESPDFYADMLLASVEPLVERARDASDRDAEIMLKEATKRARRAMSVASSVYAPAHHAEAQWMLAVAFMVMEQRGVHVSDGRPADGRDLAKRAIAEFRGAGYVADAKRAASELRARYAGRGARVASVS